MFWKLMFCITSWHAGHPAFLHLGIDGVKVLLDSSQAPSPEVRLPVAMYVSVQPSRSSPVPRPVHGSPVGLVGNPHHVGHVGDDAVPELSLDPRSIVDPLYGKVIRGLSHV